MIKQRKRALVPQRLVEVRSTTCVGDVNGRQHTFFVGVRAEIKSNVDAVCERDESHLEPVRRLVGADRQRLDDGADELHNARKVVALDAA